MKIVKLLKGKMHSKFDPMLEDGQWSIYHPITEKFITPELWSVNECNGVTGYGWSLSPFLNVDFDKSQTKFYSYEGIPIGYFKKSPNTLRMFESETFDPDLIHMTGKDHPELTLSRPIMTNWGFKMMMIEFIDYIMDDFLDMQVDFIISPSTKECHRRSHLELTENEWDLPF
ncbi:MAG: hypothetical protein M9949_14280 [Candidatus Kapabacteria bacterium]|nr:hypothetical protein [Candidatus Kapabacteria bacterium]